MTVTINKQKANPQCSGHTRKCGPQICSPSDPPHRGGQGIFKTYFISLFLNTEQRSIWCKARLLPTLYSNNSSPQRQPLLQGCVSLRDAQCTYKCSYIHHTQMVATMHALLSISQSFLYRYMYIYIHTDIYVYIHRYICVYIHAINIHIYIYLPHFPSMLFNSFNVFYCAAITWFHLSPYWQTFGLSETFC